MDYSMDYYALLSTDTPLIDVRSPIEFIQGAMPTSINLPLIMDDERAAIGTYYKRHGATAALAFGYQLISGDRYQQRLNDWRQVCLAKPNGYLCCARGGQRSHITQAFLKEIGIDYPLILGGYKALRQTALKAISEQSKKPMVLIGGYTGTGKTLLVKAQKNDGIDLEGLAHHRGSSFGRTLIPQLSQASFENHLAVTLLKKNASRWVVEDESRMIGSNYLPKCLYQQMLESPIAVIEAPFELRLEQLQKEYFDRMWTDFSVAYGEEVGWKEYSEYLYHGLFTIRSRLGAERFIDLTRKLNAALSEQQRTNSTAVHFGWLVPLLEEYYDPMYHYQLNKKLRRIVFRGMYDEVEAWLTFRS